MKHSFDKPTWFWLWYLGLFSRVFIYVHQNLHHHLMILVRLDLYYIIDRLKQCCSNSSGTFEPTVCVGDWPFLKLTNNILNYLFSSPRNNAHLSRRSLPHHAWNAYQAQVWGNPWIVWHYILPVYLSFLNIWYEIILMLYICNCQFKSSNISFSNHATHGCFVGVVKAIVKVGGLHTYPRVFINLQCWNQFFNFPIIIPRS